MEELAPDGALQCVLGQRVVAATWRLARADRLEADVFEVEGVPGRSLGLALIRDCNGARSFDTLLRYRGGTLAELWRALRTLKAFQAEAADRAEPAAPREPRLLSEPHELPIKSESRGNPGEIAVLPAATAPALTATPATAPPRLRCNQTSPRAAEFLAIQADRVSARIRAEVSRVQPPPGCHANCHRRRAYLGHAPSRSNPRPGRGLPQHSSRARARRPTAALRS